jgi:DNA ligase 1
MVKKDRSFLLNAMEDGKAIGLRKFVPVTERKRIYREVENNGVKETDKIVRFNQGIPCNVKFRNWTSNNKKYHHSINSFLRKGIYYARFFNHFSSLE